ncbi:MAG: hypothetical protein H6Q67_1879 [Firmicutes bacterium]|nr:hypothetical protein [Bacillota bacterium]
MSEIIRKTYFVYTIDIIWSTKCILLEQFLRAREILAGLYFDFYFYL